MLFTCFTLDNSTPSLWRATFNNAPINLIDYTMIRELSELFVDIEQKKEPAVLVFDSADPDYFLAHYDIAGDHPLVNSLKGPTGSHPWIALLVRWSKLPAVTISAIRGRVRGAGSEFVLACDIRSQAESGPSSVSRKSASLPFREAAQQPGYPVSSAGAERSRFCSGVRTSMAHLPRAMATSIGPFPTSSSKPSSIASFDESRRSIVRPCTISSTSSIRPPCQRTRSFLHRWTRFGEL